MKNKKFAVMFFALICIASLSACANKQEEAQVQQESEISYSDSENLEVEYPPEDNHNVTHESKLGYFMNYDPSVFTLDDTQDDIDTFYYNTAEKLDLPVYVTVQFNSELSAQAAVNGLILQSGMDGVKATKTYIGIYDIKAQNIYVEKDVNGIKQVQVFYVIPIDQGSMIIEVGSYVGVPEQIDSKLEEMIVTFSLRKIR